MVLLPSKISSITRGLILILVDAVYLLDLLFGDVGGLCKCPVILPSKWGSDNLILTIQDDSPCLVCSVIIVQPMATWLEMITSILCKIIFIHVLRILSHIENLMILDMKVISVIVSLLYCSIVVTIFVFD